MKNIIITFTLLFATTQLHAQAYERTTPNPTIKLKSKPINDEAANAVVDKHNAAIGGAAAFDSLQSIVREGIQNYYGTVEALKITFEKNKMLRYFCMQRTLNYM